MLAAANWLISIGFCLILVAVALRIIAMMRASDAAFTAARAGQIEHGRTLLRSHKTHFPGSALPRISIASLVAGLVMLLIGVGIHLTR